MTFRALLLDRGPDGAVTSSLQRIDEDRLPPGDVTVDIEYSTLNYKDGLILNGLGRLVRDYPHVPGVDFAGTVAASSDPRFALGDKVILTGWRVGELHWGGFAERARVRSDWLVPLPEGLDTRTAMAVGTAGLTAMLALTALEDHGLTREAGEVLVTGAGGGVGSMAVALLGSQGYRVAAATGRADLADYLTGLGAARIVPRADLAEATDKPLEAETWAGCIDAVGGTTLARVLGQMRRGASVAAVGLAGGADLPAKLAPFLLRGINLLGIDSVMAPPGVRRRAWDRIARDLPRDRLGPMLGAARLEDLPRLGNEILKGQIRGRVVVDVRA